MTVAPQPADPNLVRTALAVGASSAFALTIMLGALFLPRLEKSFDAMGVRLPAITEFFIGLGNTGTGLMGVVLLVWPYVAWGFKRQTGPIFSSVLIIHAAGAGFMLLCLYVGTLLPLIEMATMMAQ